MVSPVVFVGFDEVGAEDFAGRLVGHGCVGVVGEDEDGFAGVVAANAEVVDGAGPAEADFAEPVHLRRDRENHRRHRGCQHPVRRLRCLRESPPPKRLLDGKRPVPWTNATASRIRKHNSIRGWDCCGFGGGLGSTFYFITDPVESGGAGQVVVRQLSDPESMVGATVDQVRSMIPEGWIEAPMNKGAGIKWMSPGKVPGARGYVEYSFDGVPDAEDPVHAGGAYIKLAAGGENWRAAAPGNDVLTDPSTPDVTVFSRGSTGPLDLTGEFKFEVGAP